MYAQMLMSKCLQMIQMFLFRQSIKKFQQVFVIFRPAMIQVQDWLSKSSTLLNTNTVDVART